MMIGTHGFTSQLTKKKAFIKKQNTFFLIARIFLSSYFAVSIKNDNANF